MTTPENDALEDLAYATAEGPSDQLEAGGAGTEDLGDYGDFGDSGDYGDFGDSGDLGDYAASDQGDFGDFGDSYEPDAGDYGDFGSEDSMGVEAAQETINREMASVLSAESEDEFLGKIRGFLKKVAPIASVVGKVARFIPHPAAQGLATVADVVSKVRAEGGPVEDALEAVAEVAARDPRALPVVAGLAARSVLKNAAPRMPPAQRQQVARAVTRATTDLAKAGGTKALLAVPRITAAVNRTAATNGTPPQARPRVLVRTMARLAQTPPALRNLSRPSRRAQRILASLGNMGGGMAYGGMGYGGSGNGRMGNGGMGYGGMGYGGPRRGPFRERRIRISGPATIFIRSDY